MWAGKPLRLLGRRQRQSEGTHGTHVWAKGAQGDSRRQE